MFGPNYFLTLGVAGGLALAQLGEAESARALGEDTLQRSRRVLRSDHWFTLGAATGLALALAQLGEAEPARALCGEGPAGSSAWRSS